MSGLRHDGAHYGDEQEFVDQYTPFLLDGLDAGDAVIAVTTESNVAALRRTLGSRAADVDFIAAERWFAKPESTIRAYHHRFVSALRDGHEHIRVLGEVQFGESPREHARWIRYESLLNYAFAEVPAWIVCPYRSDVLAPAVAGSVDQTHDHLFDNGSRTPCALHGSPQYLGLQNPGELTIEVPGWPAALDLDLPLPSSQVRALVRRAVGTVAMPTAPLDDRRMSDTVVLCSELVWNVACHAFGVGRLRLWLEPEGAVVGVVDDSGPGFDPRTGYRPPDSTDRASRGLWMARQLCEELQVAERGQGGSRVSFRI